ncbi:sulfite exporter TauE/SafE family protein [Metabacillus herbersteinensis]|uniref:Probable membrane transporter protein n=1 Tax=Metabacillus herbersteinensis TaxID=283816 RepID=A0ABV6GAK8_9BACI
MEWVIFMIGFVATFVGTLAGSGGIISMPALMLTGVPIHNIIAANKFSNTISSFSSFYVLLKGKQIRVKDALIILPFPLLGGLTGALIATSLSEKTMTIIALILLLFALLLNFLNKPVQKEDHLEKTPKKLFPLLYGIGAYDGMFGPGQGTLLMIVYMKQGYSYLKSVGFTRFQTFVSCFGATSLYLFQDVIKWDVTISLAAGSLLGAQISVSVAKKIKLNQAIWIIRTVTILLILQLVYSLFSGGGISK